MTDVPTLRYCPNRQRCAFEDERSGDLDALRFLDKVHSQNLKGLQVVTLAILKHASAPRVSLPLQTYYGIQKLSDYDHQR